MSRLDAMKSSFSPTEHSIKKRDIELPENSVKFQKELKNTNEKRELLNQATILVASQQGKLNTSSNLHSVEHFNALSQNPKSPTSKNHGCKFKTTDKLLAVSVDDLYDKKRMPKLTEYLKNSGIPVTLFPHSGANKNILKEMRALPNGKLGWHGKIPGKLDATPPNGTDKSVIAWSHGKDGENRKKELGKETIARGVLCDREKRIGKFDQHDMPSCSLGDKPNILLKKERDNVLKNGGILSVHLHHAGKGKAGLYELKQTVDIFKANGGKIIHIDQLKGCGK